MSKSDQNNKEKLASEMRRDYLRDWRRKNPDKVRQDNRKYWLNKVEQRSNESELRGVFSDAENEVRTEV